LTALIKPGLLLGLFIEKEPPLDDHVISDLNGYMTLSGTWSGSRASGLCPSHHFEV